MQITTSRFSVCLFSAFLVCVSFPLNYDDNVECISSLNNVIINITIILCVEQNKYLDLYTVYNMHKRDINCHLLILELSQLVLQ